MGLSKTVILISNVNEEDEALEEGDFSELIELGEKLMGVSDEMMLEREYKVFR
jgi:hypothetical protein